MTAPGFTYSTQIKGDVFIIRAQGYLDEKGGTMVRQAVETAFPKGFQKFVLNLVDTPVINSMGVAQILETAELVIDQRQGNLAFVGLNELTNGVFKMVGLLKMGKSFALEEEAIHFLSAS
ncbi:MAG: STAS domain-containing protein [Candidatus Riflebacteria bacterium]|nr:STAS domain-containing protein [Candidatus Riflebacteria bacterium]